MGSRASRARSERGASLTRSAPVMELPPAADRQTSASKLVKQPSSAVDSLADNDHILTSPTTMRWLLLGIFVGGFALSGTRTVAGELLRQFSALIFP
jgi:hypothetical protein